VSPARCSERAPDPADLLHNMSQAPRSTLRVAPRHRAKPGLRFSLPAEWWDGYDGQPTTLLRLFGIAVPPDPGDALGALMAAADASLDAASIPPVLAMDCHPFTGFGTASLLHFAIVSRCAGRLFLRARSPRLDPDALFQTWSTVDPRVVAPREDRP
jgi:hypothetical protein